MPADADPRSWRRKLDPALDYWRRYLRWIEKNPQSATEVENAIKWIGYLAAAYYRRARDSLAVSELVHRSSDLLSFLHDRCFELASKETFGAKDYSRAEYLLGFLETSEIIFELGGRLVGGVAGKWAVVVVIQLLKTSLRLLLLYQRRRMLPYPTIPPVERIKAKRGAATRRSNNNNGISTLRRSGRSMRSLDSRTGSLSEALYASEETSPLSGSQLAGEVAYVCQPLVHLAALRRFGGRSWTPWVVSLGMDLASHGLASPSASDPPLSFPSHSELLRRRTHLALYLLRSPFYDAVTKRWLLAAILVVRRRLPFGRTLADILLAYIPHLRGIYGYLWAK